MPVPVTTPTYTGQSQLPSRWVLQVDTASSAASPAWVTVFGMQSFTPAFNPNLVDNSDFDTGIWSSQTVTSLAWQLTGTVEHKKYNGAEDVAQAFIRAAATPVTGSVTLVHVRWFDRYGGTESFDGWGIPSWVNQGGSSKDTEKIQITISGQGAPTAPANPYATAVAPTVGSALPSGVAVGGLVSITGTNFTGATDVRFGATTVGALGTGYIINSDTSITAKMPAGSAGSAPVTVINVTGTSNALAYTRGA